MKIKIALFMIASAVAIGAGIARAEDVSSKNTHVGIRAPGETGQQTRVLHSLALALSDGNEAMDFLHGPPGDVELDKDRLNPLTVWIAISTATRITSHVTVLRSG
jgi:hypothetical protein